MGTLCKCIVGALPYIHYVMTSPFHGVKVLHPAQYGQTQTLSRVPRKQKREQRRHPSCVGHVASGVFYSALANLQLGGNICYPASKPLRNKHQPQRRSKPIRSANWQPLEAAGALSTHRISCVA